MAASREGKKRLDVWIDDATMQALKIYEIQHGDMEHGEAVNKAILMLVKAK